MPFSYRCRRCSSLVSSHLLMTRCPSCGYKALRRYKSKEYLKQAHAPSHKLKPYHNYKAEEKGDF